MCVDGCVRAGARACACARVALLIQHATRHHIGICGLSGSIIFFDIISYMAQFSEKNFIEHNMCFDFLYNFYLNFKNNSARYCHKCEKSSCKLPVILVGY
jgi:hypothetical protein